MVEPIFDDVLIRTLNVWPVALTILVLYADEGVVLVPLHDARGGGRASAR